MYKGHWTQNYDAERKFCTQFSFTSFSIDYSKIEKITIRIRN